MTILSRDEIAEIVSIETLDGITHLGPPMDALVDTAYAYHAAKRDSGIYAAALREAVAIIDGLADQQAMQDDWYVTQLTYLRALAACETEKDGTS